MKTRDVFLGTAITRAFKRAEQVNTCPALEDIAALVDGTIQGTLRDDIMGHMATCDRCRQVFTMTGELAEHEKEYGRGRWSKVSSAFAVAAVMVLAISMTFRYLPSEQPRKAKIENPGGSPAGTRVTAEKAGKQPEETVADRSEGKRFTPLPAAKTAALLAAGGSPERLARAIEGGEKRPFGFAEAPSRAAISFRTGIYGLDLEVALLVRDREKALLNLNRISQLLKAPEANGDIAAYFENVGQQLEDGADPEKFKGITGMVRDKLPADTGIYLGFGEWCEAARVAASMQNGDFFAREPVRYFQKKLAGKPMPKEARNALREISQSMGGRENDMVDFGLLSARIKEIIGAF